MQKNIFNTVICAYCTKLLCGQQTVLQSHQKMKSKQLAIVLNALQLSQNRQLVIFLYAVFTSMSFNLSFKKR